MTNPIRAAREQSQHGPRLEVGMCLRSVRMAFGIDQTPRTDDDDAIGAWLTAQHRHPVHAIDLEAIPRGVPLFWSGGSSRHGHIAISTGHNGMCWTTDTRRAGYFDKAPIADVTDWITRGVFLGYTLDLLGHPITPLKETRK